MMRATSLFVVIALLACAPALAHDPLRDEQQRHSEHQHDNDLKQRWESDRESNLAAARSLVVAFRETGDDRRLDEAWMLLEPAIASGATNPRTLITAAFIAQSRHHFDAAKRLIKQALTISSNNDEAWLLLASIYLVRGETEPAATACAHLQGVPPLVLLTCKARVALVNGDHRPALQRLTGLLNAIDTQHMPADMLAWSYSVAGDLAVTAEDSQQADELYRRSLDLAERTQVRAALVDVLLSEGDNEGVWRALDAGAAALPLLVRRLIVAKRLNRLHEFESEMAKVQQEFDVWISNEDWLHAREMTRFFIDVVERPDVARRLALINIELQREPEDLRLEIRTRS